jgi:hypothetical protein
MEQPATTPAIEPNADKDDPAYCEPNTSIYLMLWLDFTDICCSFLQSLWWDYLPFN